MSELFTTQPLTMTLVGERIWKLRETDETLFRKELDEYIARGYPGYFVAEIEPPHIYLQDNRKKSK